MSKRTMAEEWLEKAAGDELNDVISDATKHPDRLVRFVMADALATWSALHHVFNKLETIEALMRSEKGTVN